jgi:broad specificity phosphatase PhoE
VHFLNQEPLVMGKLIIVRHGHTSLNVPGRDERLRGWLDIPLDEQGLQEAEETAERLSGYPVEAIFSSDLRRARQTAEMLRRRTHAHVTHATELRPWNLGVFCGQRVLDIIPFLNLLNHHPELAAPSGESFYQFYGRYSQQLNTMMNLAAESSRCIVAVTHVRNLLATQTIIEHGDRDKVPVRGGPSTGAFTIVEKIDGVWRMSTDAGAPDVVAPQTQFAEARA